MLTPDHARKLFERAERAAKSSGVGDVEITAGARHSALTRFANNTIHQNVAEESRFLSVRLQVDQRTARVTTNRLDDDGIRGAVERAVAITRASEPNPELQPLPGPQSIPAVDRWRASTANSTPKERARGVKDAIDTVRSRGQVAAGIFSTEGSSSAILNSNGLFAHGAETLAVFSITALAEDSSGWVKASAVDVAAINPLALAESAAEKAARSARPRELSPGKYTVILEPAAVLDIIGQVFADFSGTALHDQRSFLSERMGKQLFGPNIAIEDDVFHPEQAGAPFDGEGAPRQRVKLVEAGVPRNAVYSRASARRASVEPTGHGFPLPNEHGEAPANIVIAGGDRSVDDMIAAAGRAILVTRLWYIREVEPYEKVMTGMTRDGTFAVEGGEIAYGIRNFRFNQSVVEMLRNVEMMSPSHRASGEEAFDMVVPAMTVRDFQFTEVTKF